MLRLIEFPQPLNDCPLAIFNVLRPSANRGRIQGLANAHVFLQANSPDRGASGVKPGLVL